ncbi:MAG: hypothetical protein IEMM0008_0659 [bacterium]|nr:MAG: hypothetical protein IEMM0008_0659 [bacterium]
MEIIRRGLILPEEEAVANQLKNLPDHWWCIGGDGNRFSFKKGSGTQIDFIVIAPKGIFFIDSKNIRTIELSGGNTVRFLSSSGKQIRKTTKRDNPVEDIIEERYQAKDWLRNRGLEDFLTRDRKDLKVFLHGLVVIANEQTVQYKNCTLDQLNYYSHKYPTLIPISMLTTNYFESMSLPPNCKNLTQEEMWVLFKLFHNPDMTITQILNEIRKEEDKLFREQQVFLEKLRLLEQENIQLAQKSNDLEGTRNQLMSMNQELKEAVQSHDQTIQSLSGERDDLDHLNNKLKEEILELEQLKEQSKEMDGYRRKTDELSKKVNSLEHEKKKLIKKNDNYLASSIVKKLKGYKIASITFAFVIGLCTLYIWLSPDMKVNDAGRLDKINSSNTLATLETLFPSMEAFYKEKKYKKLVTMWEEYILKGDDIEPNELVKGFHKYDMLIKYLAKSYQKSTNKEAKRKASLYYDIYAEIANDPKEIIDAHYWRSISHIELESDLDESIRDLKEASKLNKEKLKDFYPNKIRIIMNLALSYQTIETGITITGSKKKNYSKALRVNDFFEEALKYYEKGRYLALDQKDIKMQANFQNAMGHLYKYKNNYRKAYGKFMSVIYLLSGYQKQSPEVAEKIMVAYNDAGATASGMNFTRSAIKNYVKAIALSEDSNSLVGMQKRKIYQANFRRNLGNLYLKTKNYNNALKELEKAYGLAKELELSKVSEYKKLFDIAKKKLVLY